MRITGLTKEREAELLEIYKGLEKDHPVIIKIDTMLDLVKMSWAGKLKTEDDSI